MTTQFHKNSKLGGILLEWWKGLDKDRASRAELRRAASVTAVVLTSAYQRLFRRLHEAGWQGASRSNLCDRLAAAVGLLAHVEDNDERALALTMSLAEDSNRPPVSELRFRRVLESPDLDSLFLGLRRLLPLMKNRANILELTNDVIRWNDSVKKRWAYAYKWPEKPGN
jgi:CRISPR system Cascade subunit CasB